MASFDKPAFNPSKPNFSVEQHKFPSGSVVKLLKPVVDDDVLYFHKIGEVGIVFGYSHDYVICTFGLDTVCRPECWFSSVNADSK